jgi:hypothetical protein
MSTLAMTIPVDDWQFWVVTAAFVVALGWLLRGVVPIPIVSRRYRRRKRQKRVTLTVGGKAAK